MTRVDGPQRLDLVLAGSTLVSLDGELPAPPARPLWVSTRWRTSTPAACTSWPRTPRAGSAASRRRWSTPLRTMRPPGRGGDAAVAVADLFNLTLTPTGGTAEPYAFVTVVPGPNRIDAVLASRSALAHAARRCPPTGRPWSTYQLVAAD